MGILTFWLTNVKGGDRGQGSGVSAQGSGVRGRGLVVKSWSSELELESGIVDFLFRSF